MSEIPMAANRPAARPKDRRRHKGDGSRETRKAPPRPASKQIDGTRYCVIRGAPP